MRKQNEVLQFFTNWAEHNDNVRVAILTGSRADATAAPDRFSDYDIGLYVRDLSHFQNNDDWLLAFGPIMMRWPMLPRSTFNENWITRLILFDDGVRMDFQITDKRSFEAGDIEDDFRVLVDKEGVTADLANLGACGHWVEQPSATQYETLTHDFWWDASYVAKSLARENLPFARYMLDCELRFSYLHKMIDWYIGAHNEWAVNTGIHGRRFKHHLDAELWAQYESTFAGPNLEDNWLAYYQLMQLFRTLGCELAPRLGLVYPVNLDKRVSSYIQSIRDLGKV